MKTKQKMLMFACLSWAMGMGCLFNAWQQRGKNTKEIQNSENQKKPAAVDQQGFKVSANYDRYPSYGNWSGAYEKCFLNTFGMQDNDITGTIAMPKITDDFLETDFLKLVKTKCRLNRN